MGLSKKQIAFNAKVQSRIDAEVKAGRLLWDPQKGKYYNEATHRYTTVFNTKRLISYELRHPGSARYEAYSVGKAMQRPRKTPEGKRKVTTVKGKRIPIRQLRRRRVQSVNKKIQKILPEGGSAKFGQHWQDKRLTDQFSLNVDVDVTEDNVHDVLAQSAAIYRTKIGDPTSAILQEKMHIYKTRRATFAMRMNFKTNVMQDEIKPGVMEDAQWGPWVGYTANKTAFDTEGHALLREWLARVLDYSVKNGHVHLEFVEFFVTSMVPEKAWW